MLGDVGAFSETLLPDLALRGYQRPPAERIAEAIRTRSGQQFAVCFSRQSGKDEMLAQLLAWLLVRYQRQGGSVVVAAPVREQTQITRARLISRLQATPVTQGYHARGQSVSLGNAHVSFLPAGPDAAVRGHSATLLLVANEAQDVDPGIWDARFDPMAASSNAVTLFMGTQWDTNGLLHRQMEHLSALEAQDGVQRVYKVPWWLVEPELPAYGQRVRARMAQLGAEHPFIRTEYELVPLDSEGGLFPPQRQAQMKGTHSRRHSAEPGKTYAMLLDVAGEEEEGSGPEAFINAGRRDATALTIVEVVRDGRELPTYHVVDRLAWTGQRHTRLYDQLCDLAKNVWHTRAIVVDATGVGAGLASFLADRLGKGPRPITVEAFTFTAKSKSDLGWGFIGLIDSGRYKEYAGDPDELTRIFWHQAAACAYEVMPGPNRLLRWSVPAGRGHDDLLISAALSARLDEIDWRPRTARGS